MNENTKTDYTFEITELINNTTEDFSFKQVVDLLGIPLYCPNCNSVLPITVDRLNKEFSCSCGKSFYVSAKNSLLSD